MFSCICPGAGKPVGRVCDRANTGEMNRHLLDISAAAEGRHALVVLDCAGWRCSKVLEIRSNATLLRLSRYSPELNRAETVFQFLKTRHYANQVFESAGAMKEKAEVGDEFTRDAARIRSLGARSWATLTVGTLAEQPTA